MNREETLEIMQRYKILPEKRFGQNFLCNDDITDLIISESGIEPSSRVLEIGPGIGALTRKIAGMKADITAVEIDLRLASYLKEDLPSVKVIASDFLKIKREDIGPFDRIISNIPYYVMTPIMNKLLSGFSDALSMTFMVEESALARIKASYGTKQYGPLSVLVSLYGEFNKVINVPDSAFIPRPNTLSSVITLKRTDEHSDVLCPEFLAFLETSFSQRRKKYLNSLGAVCGREKASSVISAVGLDENVRAEDIRPEIFRKIFDLIR